MKQPCRSLAGVRIAATIVLLASGARAYGEPIVTTALPRPLGKGSVVVLRPSAGNHDPPADGAGDLLIHFHGAADTLRQAMERAGTTATVVVVNQPGLSAAYAAPFRDDPNLFTRLLAEPAHVTGDDDDDDAPAPRWRRVSLSCFSAGYGAVREILKDPHAAAQIDEIVAADSIYAGLEQSATDDAPGPRRVDARDMAGFVAFAGAAAGGDKVFVVTHSAQPTPYASTTETADYLLEQLGLERHRTEPLAAEVFPLLSQAGRGGFRVLGFAGASGPAHLFHLRSIDRWWIIAEELRAEPDSPDTGGRH